MNWVISTVQEGVLGNFNHTGRKILRNLYGMIIRNTANYFRNLPICVCSSRKFDKKNGEKCKNHEEKHKIDVKENEKTCEQHAQNLGTEAKNRLFLRPKSGVGKNGHPTFLG
nr:hypothetical protein [uncultured Prevotella sp.]